MMNRGGVAMHRTIFQLVLFVVLAACVAVARAQYGPDGDYMPDRVDALVERVHADLNHGYAVWRLSDGDRDRLNHAERELREFAKQWRRRKFDKDKLDDSIAAVQHVLDNNHLKGRERD